MKDTNPKDAIGCTKLPLNLVPPAAIALASLAHLDGALKYGAWNWRKTGVRTSIYVDALLRHVEKWFHGEEVDADSGLSHLAHAMACLNIIVDARAHGSLVDDRPPAVDLTTYMDKLMPHVARLRELRQKEEWASGTAAEKRAAAQRYREGVEESIDRVLEKWTLEGIDSDGKPCVLVSPFDPFGDRGKEVEEGIFQKELLGSKFPNRYWKYGAWEVMVGPDTSESPQGLPRSIP